MLIQGLVCAMPHGLKVIRLLFILNFYVAVQTGSCLAWPGTRRLFFFDGTYIRPSYSISIDVRLRKDNSSAIGVEITLSKKRFVE